MKLSCIFNSHFWEPSRLIWEEPKEAPAGPAQAPNAPAAVPDEKTAAEAAAKLAAEKEKAKTARVAGDAEQALAGAKADAEARQKLGDGPAAAPEKPAVAAESGKDQPAQAAQIETGKAAAAAQGAVAGATAGGAASALAEVGAASEAAEGADKWGDMITKLSEKVEALIDKLSKWLDKAFGGSKEKKAEGRQHFLVSPAGAQNKLKLKDAFNETRGTMILEAAPKREVHAAEEGKVVEKNVDSANVGTVVIERPTGDKIIYKGIKVDSAISVGTEIKQSSGTKIGIAESGVFELGFADKAGAKRNPQQYLTPYLSNLPADAAAPPDATANAPAQAPPARATPAPKPTPAQTEALARAAKVPGPIGLAAAATQVAQKIPEAPKKAPLPLWAKLASKDFDEKTGTVKTSVEKPFTYPLLSENDPYFDLVSIEPASNEARLKVNGTDYVVVVKGVTFPQGTAATRTPGDRERALQVTWGPGEVTLALRDKDDKPADAEKFFEAIARIIVGQAYSPEEAKLVNGMIDNVKRIIEEKKKKTASLPVNPPKNEPS